MCRFYCNTYTCGCERESWFSPCERDGAGPDCRGITNVFEAPAGEILCSKHRLLRKTEHIAKRLHKKHRKLEEARDAVTSILNKENGTNSLFEKEYVKQRIFLYLDELFPENKKNGEEGGERAEE